MALFASAVVSALVALLPAAVRLVRDRPLLRSLDHPALAERLAAGAKGNLLALATALAVLLVVFPRSAFWSVPLAAAAAIAAAYPLRRALYEETWSLPRYLAFALRALVAFSGLWLLLAVSPLLAWMAAPYDLPASAALAAVLWAWTAWHTDIVRALLGSAPLQDPARLDRFTRMAASCGIPPPRFEQVDLRGGVVANAVALASLRRPAILFTDTLLARLEPDEAAAICAHEIAHLEGFDPRRLRRINRVTHALIAGSVLVPVALRLSPVPPMLVWAAWAGVFLAALIWLARDRQTNETASDRRAVAITGDAEALVRALTKLHAIARAPRRLQPEVEKQATHPSLARRIRDIRDAAGSAPETLAASSTFSAAQGRLTVTFEPDRLFWMEGDEATHSLSYAHLTELRVHAPRSGRPSLVAAAGGRRWEMPVSEPDVARLQAVLDVVDGRLRASAPAADRWPEAARAVCALLAAAALLLGQFAALLLALLAIAQPVSPLLAAAGAGGLAAAALVLRDQGVGGDATRIALGIVCATLAAAGLIAATAVRARRPSPAAMRLVAAVAILALSVLSLIALQGGDLLRLHRWARAVPAASVLPAALAGALAFVHARWARALAAAAAAAGAAVFVSSFPATLDAFSADALLSRSRPPAWTTIASAPVRETRLPFAAGDLHLSPSGDSFAVWPADEWEEPSSPYVGVFGGPLTAVPARDLAFLDDQRILTMETGAGFVELVQRPVRAPLDVLSRQRVAGIASPELTIEPGTGRWSLIGIESNQLVRIEAPVGGREDQQVRSILGRRAAPLVSAAAAGTSVIAVESTYTPGALQSAGLWPLAGLLPIARMESTVWVASDGERREMGRSGAEVRCVTERSGPPRIGCAAFDGTRAHLHTLDPRTRRVTPVARIDGAFFPSGRVAAGWLPGWTAGGGPLAIDLGTGRAVRLAEASAAGGVISLAVRGRFAGAVIHGEAGSTVRLYALGD